MKHTKVCDDCGNPVSLFISRHCNACLDRIVRSRMTPEQRTRLDYLDSKFSDMADDAPRASSSGGTPDPERSKRFNEAVAYIRDYRGTFGLILDLRARREWGTKWYRLSDRQIEVVLAAKARENQPRPEQQIKVPEALNLDALPYGRTYAAVTNSTGSTTFLIFDRPKAGTKWAGWVFVKQQQGPNETRLGAQRPNQGYVGQWAGLIEQVLADIPAAVARYGRELGVCGVCALPLTNEESRQAGIGPICRTRLEKR